MSLLYETVPESEETSVQVMGDLAKYRTTIEDDDVRD
jgi:hypothetical protein